jgi:hypothetical protein
MNIQERIEMLKEMSDKEITEIKTQLAYRVILRLGAIAARTSLLLLIGYLCYLFPLFAFGSLIGLGAVTIISSIYLIVTGKVSSSEEE